MWERNGSNSWDSPGMVPTPVACSLSLSLSPSLSLSLSLSAPSGGELGGSSSSSSWVVDGPEETRGSRKVGGRWGLGVLAGRRLECGKDRMWRGSTVTHGASAHASRHRGGGVMWHVSSVLAYMRERREESGGAWRRKRPEDRVDLSGRTPRPRPPVGLGPAPQSSSTATEMNTYWCGNVRRGCLIAMVGLACVCLCVDIGEHGWRVLLL